MAKLTKRQTEAKCRELRTKEIALMQENDTLKKANENLQKVLEENGIRPQPLIVTYLVPDCYNCDCYDEAGDEELQDECYFWYDFLHAYGAWKVIGKVYGFKDEEEALTILVRLVKLDESVFKMYPEL